MNPRQTVISLQQSIHAFQRFTLDSRPAGYGKTTGITNSIYSRIAQHISLNESVIIVLPSIDLQKSYNLKFPEIIVVNSENDKSAYSKFSQALKLKKKIICITSALFLNISFEENITDYHLIIDESFIPHTHISIDARNASKVTAVNRDSSEEVSKNTTGLNVLKDIKIVLGYKSVHIAAAAIEYTFLYFWLKLNNIQFTITGAFNRHIGPTLHCADILSDSKVWSLEKQKNSIDYDYIAANRRSIGESDKHTLYYGNKSNEFKSDNPNAHYSDLNSAGSNSYIMCVNVVCEQAINPSSAGMSDLKSIYGMTDYEVHRAYSTYALYQNIGRSAIRSGNEVDAYLMSLIDTTILNNDFYNETEIQMYQLLDAPVKKARATRSDKGTGLTPAQRMAKSRAKAKLLKVVL